MLWSYKKCQKIGIARELDRVSAKIFFAQTILDKIFGTKWSNPVKTGQEKKSLVSVFACFLTAILSS